MQSLPIGEQEFTRLRERNHIYVDKTQQIFALINVGTFVFLSRPRRFGKSLLTTTLKALFESKRALFQGLWLEDKLDWQPRPSAIEVKPFCCWVSHLTKAVATSATGRWHMARTFSPADGVTGRKGGDDETL